MSIENDKNVSPIRQTITSSPFRNKSGTVVDIVANFRNMAERTSA
jgi:hypothetical protein